MLMYGLIGLCFILVGVVGLQFTYLFYADRMDSERRRHLTALEHRCAELTAELEAANHVIEEQALLLETPVSGLAVDDEAWADVIEER